MFALEIFVLVEVQKQLVQSVDALFINVEIGNSTST